MRNYDIKGLNKWRYRELLAICRQNDPKRRSLIADAAREADLAGDTAILRNAVNGIRYEECGYYGSRSSFFLARRRFFKILDERMKQQERAV